MKSVCFVLLAAAALIFVQAGFAQVPRTMSYQGYYTKNGQPFTGSYQMIFKLYTVQSGGSQVWSQTFSSVPISKGVYSVVLDVSTITFDKQYWLETVINNVISATRTQLTGVPYSLGPWNPIDTNVYFNGGNVGIGTNLPISKLDVVGYGFFRGGLGTNGLEVGWGSEVNVDQGCDQCIINVGGRFKVADDGKVGIGSNAPHHRLRIGNSSSSLWTSNLWGGALELENGAAIGWRSNTGGNRFGMGHTNNGFYIFRTASDPGTTASGTAYDFMIDDNGNVGIGTTFPSAALEVAGHTKTQVLEITGGSDLAEPFETVDRSELEPGTVMVIDADNPGKLKMSVRTYDPKVAGIVSGAGGVKAGITLRQHGVIEGNSLIAIAGRVYCKAEAVSAPIEPGDLLTTSNIPGHAMKAADAARSHGAVIGKAMSALSSGKGLVLVLVNLQ
jgi:hypothetical protein